MRQIVDDEHFRVYRIVTRYIEVVAVGRLLLLVDDMLTGRCFCQPEYLLIVAVLPLGQSIHFVRTVISLLCSLIASALGGYAGANMRKKKRYSHIKK